MEIDDTGKERRNALAVSAALFTAAFIKLKVPSLIGEYLKVEPAPESAARLWALAAIVGFYVLMRYHFSDSRIDAAAQENLAFAKKVTRQTRYYPGRGWFSSLAHKEWEGIANEIAKSRREGIPEVLPRFFEVRSAYVPIFGSWLIFRFGINQTVLDRSPDLWINYPDEVSVRVPARSTFIRYSLVMNRLNHRFFDSKAAWEVNTVYVVCCAAVGACILRAIESTSALPLP